MLSGRSASPDLTSARRSRAPRRPLPTAEAHAYPGDSPLATWTAAPQENYSNILIPGARTQVTVARGKMAGCGCPILDFASFAKSRACPELVEWVGTFSPAS